MPENKRCFCGQDSMKKENFNKEIFLAAIGIGLFYMILKLTGIL